MQLERLHILTRADCTTRNTAKATRLRRAYDELEHRIGELAAEEELNAMRPDLDGRQIMEILEIPARTRRRRGVPVPARAPRSRTARSVPTAPSPGRRRELAGRGLVRPAACGQSPPTVGRWRRDGDSAFSPSGAPLLSDSVPSSRLIPRLTTAKSTPSSR